MKLIELLLEIRVDAAWEKIYKDNERFDKLDRELFDQLNDLYPKTNNTFNKGYFNWLYRMWDRGYLKPDKFDKMAQVMSLFDQFKDRFDVKDRDINRYKTAEDFYEKVEPLLNADEEELMTKKELQSHIVETEIEKVYDDEYFQVYIPETERASCIIGKGTRWCTAADSDRNQFDSYNEQGKLYVIVNENGEKFQLHFESGQLMDESNHSVALLSIGQLDYDYFWDLIEWLEARAPDLIQFGHLVFNNTSNSYGSYGHDIFYTQYTYELGEKLISEESAKYSFIGDFIHYGDETMSALGIYGVTDVDDLEYFADDINYALEKEYHFDFDTKQHIIAHLLDVIEKEEARGKYIDYDEFPFLYKSKKLFDNLKRYNLQLSKQYKISNGDTIKIIGVPENKDAPDDYVKVDYIKKGQGRWDGKVVDMSIERVSNLIRNPVLF